MTTDYLPIDCDQHSVLELLAMRRARIMVQSKSPQGTVSVVEAIVFDVLTRDGAEYLVLRNQAGNEFSVRLDRLLSLSTPDGEPFWRQKTVVS